MIQTWKNLRGGSGGRSYLKPFSLIRGNVFQSVVSAQNCRHHLMWYHWLWKFPIFFQPIIIQNYDVYSNLHWFYTFCTGVCLHRSPVIQSNWMFFQMALAQRLMQFSVREYQISLEMFFLNCSNIYRMTSAYLYLSLIFQVFHILNEN